MTRFTTSTRRHALGVLGAGLSLLVFVAGCGAPLPSPLQSPATTVNPTATVAATATSAPVTLTPVASNLAATATAGPSPTVPSTPNAGATSTAVIATVTAAAATKAPVATQTPQPNRSPATNSDGGALAQPTPVAGNGVTVLSFSATSVRGGPANVTARGTPGAVCTLNQVRTVNGAAQNTPLANVPVQIAAADGGLAWIWVTDANAPAGPQLIEVNCGAAGNARFTMRIDP